MHIGPRAMTDIRGRRMAMIFQEPMTSLNPCYTIGNQLLEALRRHRKVSAVQARERAVYLLEKVGITAAASRLRQYPHQLSGGLRQRVMIAMGLMCDPLLLIADEPTTALDVTIQAQILAQLAALQKEFNMGLILITHDLGVVARVADRVSVMYCGEVFETGDVTEIFEQPLHPYTQGLMECIPIPGKTRPGDHLGAIPGIVPTPIGDLHGCTFRNRCAYAHDRCGQSDIEMVAVSPGRGYRCLLDPEQRRRRMMEREAS
jgi:peptide/nickel transport system ATP-binding protein